MSYKILILFIALFLSSCQPDGYEVLENRDYKLDEVILGLAYVPDSNIEHQADTKEHLNNLNIHDVRLNLSWKLREPEQGQYSDENMIKRIDFYISEDIDLFLTIDLKAIPDWANELNEDEFLKAYELFVGHTLDLYASDLYIIQLGNEIDWELEESLNDDLDLYIEMNNILYMLAQDYNLDVAVSSISSGGLQSLAFSYEQLDNVFFKKGPLYSESDIEKYKPRIEQTRMMFDRVYKEAKYDAVDLHFYDDYWNWYTYKSVVENLVHEDTYFVASEFGGPHPQMEPKEDDYRANQLYYYIDGLDQLAIEKAYYFKLHEDITGTVYHPYSYLISKDGEVTKTYEVLRAFGQNVLK